ncbi:MAG TPA: hypothetical protein V6C72_13555 [Chroococcales cyanobacterium]
MNLTRRLCAFVSGGILLLGTAFMLNAVPALADSESGGFFFYNMDSGGPIGMGESQSGSVPNSQSGTETGGPTMGGEESESGATSAGGDSESGGEVSIGANNESDFGQPAVYVRNYHWHQPNK